MWLPVDCGDGCFASSNPKPAPQPLAAHKILSALPGSYLRSTARPLLWGVPRGCCGISSEVEVTVKLNPVFDTTHFKRLSISGEGGRGGCFPPFFSVYNPRGSVPFVGLFCV